MEAVAQRKIIRAVRNSTELEGVFGVPVLSLPTLFTLVASLSGFALCTGLYLAGTLNGLSVVVLNSIIIFFSFTPLHEATHRSFSRITWLNDMLGTVSAQLILPGFNTSLYRFLHVTHHQHTGELGTDPDEPFLSGPLFSRTIRWAFLDILWIRYYLKVWSQRPVTERVRFCIGVLAYLSVFAVGFSSSFAVEFFMAFVTPMLLGRVILVYLFAYIHHPQGVEQRNDPIGATGMIDAHPVSRLLMLGQTRHLIHHMYPGLPWYRYDRVWDVAKEKIPASLVNWGRFLGRISV